MNVSYVATVTRRTVYVRVGTATSPDTVLCTYGAHNHNPHDDSCTCSEQHRTACLAQGHALRIATNLVAELEPGERRELVFRERDCEIEHLLDVGEVHGRVGACAPVARVEPEHDSEPRRLGKRERLF